MGDYSEVMEIWRIRYRGFRMQFFYLNGGGDFLKRGCRCGRGLFVRFIELIKKMMR